MKKKSIYNILLQYLITLIIIPIITQQNCFGQDKIHLTYGIYLKKIIPDFKENKFYAEFYWWLKYKNDSSKTGISNSQVTKLQYVNASESEHDAINNEIDEDMLLKDSFHYVTGTHQGYFFFDPDFSNYPFDKQKLLIEIEHSLLSQNKIIIEPDLSSYVYSKMDSSIYGIGFELLKKNNYSLRVTNSHIKTDTSTYNSNFGDPNFPAKSHYSRLTHEIYLSRNIAPYVTKLFIPLAIILFLVYFVFFIPADKLDMAAGLTVTSLLSAIAFQFTINSELPEIGYLIYIDKIFYLTYLLIVLAMGESLITFYLDNSGNKRIAINIDKISRIVFPLLFAIGCLLFKN